ncbi:MAG: FAD-dependent oxidoreductase [Anaerolineae bacterium]
MDGPRVLIIGGGISGITAALNLAQRGVAVDLVERESRLGGNALTVCCKAINGLCQYCGACLVADRLQAIRSCQGIAVHSSSSITNLDVETNDFSYRLSPSLQTEPGIANAIIVATGFDHFDAHTKGPYGYGILPMVVSGEEMERRLKGEGQMLYDTQQPREVAFIQCVGSRDEHAGRGWCSQVCCRYGVRLARLLKAHSPQTNITVFKMDIQTTGCDSTAFQQAQEEGIQFVVGLPAVVRRSESNSGKACLFFDDVLGGKVRQQEFDLVVLATGIEPRHDATDWAQALSINTNRFGFFASSGDGTTTIKPGVFLAGCCQSPRSISESIAHANLTAETCYRYLQEQVL